jgi:hypothetical protein
MKLEAQGRGLMNVGGGTIELTDDGVMLNKKNVSSSDGGFLDMAISLAAATKGGMLMPYTSIHSVILNHGGFMSAPFIQVLMVGEVAVSDEETAVKTPSCLLFKKAAMSEFEALKLEIEKRVSAARKAGARETAAPTSIADEIAKLGGLLKDGLITQAEFDAQKKQLLGGR